MPVLASKPTLLPEWATSPSVMDPPHKRAVASIVDFLGLDDPTNGLPTPAALAAPIEMLGVKTLPKVAPKRAANELVDLLLGRSKRVPLPSVYKEIPDADASMAALLQSRTHTLPPNPTNLVIPWGNPHFVPVARTLSRADGITEAYARRVDLPGVPPSRLAKNVDLLYKNPAAASATRKLSPTSVAAQMEAHPTQLSIAKKTGSVQNAISGTGVKALTDTEIKRLLEGPKKAFQNGLITRKQMESLLHKNQQKIDMYKTALQKTDTALYRKQMEEKIAKAKAKAGGR